MNNNIFHNFSAIALLAVGFTLGSTSCQQTEDYIFDKSVNERIEAQVQELRTLLISSSEGWILDYIPGKGQQYGGYYIGLKFSDKDEVLATTEELKNTEKWYKSSYTVGKDRNVSINFDTGNMAIHRYTTPDSTYAGGISLGYEGDSEFNLVKIVSKDEIQVRGKKTNNLMTLRRATSSIDDFMNTIRTMKTQIFNPTDMGKQYQDALEGTLGGKSQLFKVNATGLNVYTYTTEGNAKIDTASYFVTPQGIRFLKPVEGVSEMTWADGKLNAGTATLTARRDPYRDSYAAYLGEYRLDIGENQVFDVTFQENGYNKYRIVSPQIPYEIIASYDTSTDRFIIHSQFIKNLDNGNKVYLYTMNGKSLLFSTATGLRSSLVKDSTPKKYKMVDIGQGNFDPPANGMILWTLDASGNGAGRYKDLAPSWLGSLTFTRKN